jgi:hypothetical protein
MQKQCLERHDDNVKGVLLNSLVVAKTLKEA